MRSRQTLRVVTFGVTRTGPPPLPGTGREPRKGWRGLVTGPAQRRGFPGFAPHHARRVQNLSIVDFAGATFVLPPGKQLCVLG
jgi:hypothetical protein